MGLRFRQVHLDFHTSEHIDNIGSDFDGDEFAETLKAAHVDSVTCFSKCHHGWSYHKTEVGKAHPNLKCELLELQIESCHKNNINVPVYVSVGFDELSAREHPEWCVVAPDGMTCDPFKAQWKKLCLNTGYLEHVIAQTKEVADNFDADGLFFDIILPWQCCCNKCLADMLDNGLDPENNQDRERFVNMVLKNYYQRMNEAVRSIKPDMPIFHNSGHIYPEFVKYQSHLEIESLPTGGWGYDHFPMSAKYCSALGEEFLGMTGKFHTTWGEFGGFKHPNALRYECSAMVAYGAKCSVGDQLDPTGKIDQGTYDLIGAAYKEVRDKQDYCDNVKTVAQIGLLGSDLSDRRKQSDIGASRILLEGHFLFDVIDSGMDFSKYQMLLLPDDCKINVELKAKLDSYVESGGKLFLTGKSGFDENGEFIFDIGSRVEGLSEFMPDFILPDQSCRPGFISSAMVMYMKSHRLKVNEGKSLGEVYDPYFNRSYKHFCSHQHAPAKKEPSGYDCGVIYGNVCYLAHPVFSIYSAFGTVALKDYTVKAIELLLGERLLSVNLPSTARVSLMEKGDGQSYILHLLYANTVKRGGQMSLASGSVSGRAGSIEVIEDLLALDNVEVEFRTDENVDSLQLACTGERLGFEEDGGSVKFRLSRLQCHEIVEIKTGQSCFVW